MTTPTEIYLVLQVSVNTNTPLLVTLSHPGVDALIDLHETSFTDFAIEDGVRQLEDNQCSYMIAELGKHQRIEDEIHSQIANCEAFFDDLAGEDDPRSVAVGQELDQWIQLAKEIEDVS